MFRFSPVGLWAAFFLGSVALAVGLHWASFPAATLLGPLLAGVAFALGGADLTMPRWAFAVRKLWWAAWSVNMQQKNAQVDANDWRVA
ncbi:hypothetical protein SAMN05660653_01337 [Desulfonatronum thiosulfatophilum]|uniref:Uncharacterized protein n=1 Tax=Desulfonatronum thiosulfatophilum TaxID=617002 RepID=A0A1G6C5Y7_9BACT|nr:hypothetical protein [Desulfonatronum thiosulfatophilum]SDB28277.1 hypothetical protein SAMN05660653_01337 [Desulfonatronum thiosulfatophilum]